MALLRGGATQTIDIYAQTKNIGDHYHNYATHGPGPLTALVHMHMVEDSRYSLFNIGKLKFVSFV